jgi:putative AlgH/UPF0301 family transcriptional regulator
MSGNRVVKTLYCALLRLAMKFDKKRASKSMIYRPYVSDREFKSHSTQYFASIVDKILDKGTFYNPSRMDLSLKALVKSEFRKNSMKVESQVRINAAFAILRKFSSIWAQFEETTPITAKRLSKEDRFKVSLTSDINKGVLLCAHPMVNGAMQRSVVLLLEHTTDYSYGIIVNKKSDHTLDSATLNLPEDILTAFGGNEVMYGGNIRRLQYLHPHANCGGDEIPGTSIPFFHSGNIAKAIKKTKKDVSLKDSFHFFVGCCIWKGGVLKREIDEGTWLLVKGESDVILKDAESSPIPDSYATKNHRIVPESKYFGDSLLSSDGKDGSVADRDYEAFEGQNETWCKVMRSIGRNTTHFASLSPAVDASNVEPVSWYYQDEDAEEDDDDFD